MTQLLFRLSCFESSKKSNPGLQGSLESFSFDFSIPTKTTPTGEGINTSRILSLVFKRRADKSDRRWRQHFSRTFPINSIKCVGLNGA